MSPYERHRAAAVYRLGQLESLVARYRELLTKSALVRNDASAHSTPYWVERLDSAHTELHRSLEFASTRAVLNSAPT